jgi:hypothetical protein
MDRACGVSSNGFVWSLIWVSGRTDQFAFAFGFLPEAKSGIRVFVGFGLSIAFGFLMWRIGEP